MGRAREKEPRETGGMVARARVVEEMREQKKEPARERGWTAVINDGAARAKTRAMAQAGRKAHKRAGIQRWQLKTNGGGALRRKCQAEQGGKDQRWTWQGSYGSTPGGMCQGGGNCIKMRQNREESWKEGCKEGTGMLYSVRKGRSHTATQRVAPRQGKYKARK